MYVHTLYVHLQITVKHSKRKRSPQDQNDEVVEAGTSSNAESIDTLNQQPLQVGNLVACYLEKYKDEEPQIGKILQIKTETVIVNWMSGSYSDYWYPCKVQRQPWTEEIPTSSIICEVTLSRASRLLEPMKRKLKHMYAKM